MTTTIQYYTYSEERACIHICSAMFWHSRARISSFIIIIVISFFARVHVCEKRSCPQRVKRNNNIIEFTFSNRTFQSINRVRRSLLSCCDLRLRLVNVDSHVRFRCDYRFVFVFNLRRTSMHVLANLRRHDLTTHFVMMFLRFKIYITRFAFDKHDEYAERTKWTLQGDND